MFTPAYKISQPRNIPEDSQTPLKAPLSTPALALWQSRVLTAIEAFLKNIKEKVIVSHTLLNSPLLMTYVPDANPALESGIMFLKQCFEKVGVPVTLSPLTTAEALKMELNRHQQAMVFWTPRCAQKVTEDPTLYAALEKFGKSRADALHTLLCQGIFNEAKKVMESGFLIRAYQEAFSDNPYNALQAFIDVILEVSGNNGLGVIPDVLDLEKKERLEARSSYLKELTVLHQTLTQLTTDYRLRESLEKSLETHPLKSSLDINALPTIKSTPGFEPVVKELLETEAKVSLLLCPTAADTELTSLALTQHFVAEGNVRVLSIEAADYPGKAAGECVRLALQDMQLKTVHLDAIKEKPLVILWKGYQQFGVYDNLVVKNKLPSFENVKVIITCKADFFKFRGYLSCFLADVSNGKVDDIQVYKVPSFANGEAKRIALSIIRPPKVLEKTESVLLSPKRRAQQEELTQFLKKLHQIWVSKGYLQAEKDQNPQVFFSYAWPKEKETLAWQQRHLLQLSQELTTLGFPTWLDIERMTGNIDEQMVGNIANSQVALIIGTPRYIERALQETNVKKEFEAISKKAQQNPAFKIFPLEFLSVPGTSSFPGNLQNHPSRCDFRRIDDGDDYLQRMTNPEFGFIPKLLVDTPAKKALYQTAYAEFQDQLQLLIAKHLIVNQGQDDVQSYDMDNRLKGYIEPYGLYSEISPLDTRFDLQKHLQAFLDKPEAKTAIVLGRAGSGKSLFALSTFKALLQPWYEYQKGSAPLPAWLPVYIQLRNYAQDPEHCIKDALKKQFSLSNEDIIALKKGLNHTQEVLIICDGYDELGSGVYPNLSESVNNWPLAKLLVTGRAEHFDRDHQPLEILSLCSPDDKAILNSAEVVYMSPFAPDEIKRYVTYYNKGRDEDTYKTLEAFPGMMSLLDNPFLLTLVLQSLPQLLKNRESNGERAVVRADIYKAFTETWFLQETKGRDLDPGNCEAFSEELAFRLFQEKTLSVVPNSLNKHGLWTFFNSKENHAAQDASPMRCSGGAYSFIHTTIFAYFTAMYFWKALSRPGCVNVWKVRLLIEERTIIDFLAEFLQTAHFREDSQTRLFKMIENSRDKSFPETASSNAMTVLNLAKTCFSGRDFRGIRIPMADLTEAILDNTNCEEAEFFGVQLIGAWMHNANLKKAIMENVAFGEYPTLVVGQKVHKCHYIKDEKILVVRTFRKIRLYDAATYTLLKEFDGLIIDPDGKVLVSDEKSAIRLLNISKNTMVNLPFFGEIEDVKFNLEGNIIGIALKNGNGVNLYDVETGTRINSFYSGHNVLSISFSVDNRYVAAYGGHHWSTLNMAPGESNKLIALNIIELWDIKTNLCLKNFEGHTSLVEDVNFSIDGLRLASAGSDNKVNIWSITTGKCLKTLQHNNAISCVNFNLDGQYIVTGGCDGVLMLWNVDTGTCLKKFTGHDDEITSISFSYNGHFISGSLDGTVRFWDIPLNFQHQRISKFGVEYSSLSISKDGCYIALGARKSVEIWNRQTGSYLKSLKGASDYVDNINFSPNGLYLAGGGHQSLRGDNKVILTLWDLTTDVRLMVIENDNLEKSIISICVSPNSLFLASTWKTKSFNFLTRDSAGIQIWDITNRQSLKFLVLEDGDCDKNFGFSSNFNPDGTLLASMGKQYIKLWDVANGVCLMTLRLNYPESDVYSKLDRFMALNFSPDGLFLVSGGFHLIVWDIRTGSPRELLKVLDIEEEIATIQSFSISPDGSCVIFSDSKHRLCILEKVNSAKSINSFTIELNNNVLALVCAENTSGTYVVSLNTDSSVACWQLITLNNKAYLQLIWSSNQTTLFLEKVCIDEARGLSSANAALLKQKITGEGVNKPMTLVQYDDNSNKLITSKKSSLILNNKEEFNTINSSTTSLPLLFQYPNSAIQRFNITKETTEKIAQKELVAAFYTP